MLKQALLAVFVASFMIFSPAGYCQDASDQDDAGQVNGTVCATDWVANKLVARIINLGDTDEIVFFVPDNTPVTKGGNNSSLANINIGDKVTVYYRNSLSGLRASRITVKQ